MNAMIDHKKKCQLKRERRQKSQSSMHDPAGKTPFVINPSVFSPADDNHNFQSQCDPAGTFLKNESLPFDNTTYPNPADDIYELTTKPGPASIARKPDNASIEEGKTRGCRG